MPAGALRKSQFAALPVQGEPGNYKVLLVTSRETRRWIIPKGWPMKGLADRNAAAQEAFEEAGVTGRVHKHPMGAYHYDKRLKDRSERVHMTVYLLEVSAEHDHWPEQSQRARQWMTVEEAAECVSDADLAGIIRLLGVTAKDALQD